MTGMRCTRNLVTNESPSLGSHQASPRKLCTDRANLSLGLGGKKPKLLITEIKTPDSSKSYQVKWLKLKPKLNLKFEKLYAESVNCKLTSFQGPGQKKTGRCAAGKPPARQLSDQHIVTNYKQHLPSLRQSQLRKERGV